MDKQFKQKAIGSVGEKLVTNTYTKLGSLVIWNTQEFGYWDLMIDDITCQVKTLTPFVKYDSWVIGKHKSGRNIENLFKCEALLIVSIPSIIKHHYDGKILRIDTKSLDKNTKFLPGANSEGLVIPRSSKSLSVITSLTSSEISSITEHSISYFTKK